MLLDWTCATTTELLFLVCSSVASVVLVASAAVRFVVFVGQESTRMHRRRRHLAAFVVVGSFGCWCESVERVAHTTLVAVFSSSSSWPAFL